MNQHGKRAAAALLILAAALGCDVRPARTTRQLQVRIEFATSRGQEVIGGIVQTEHSSAQVSWSDPSHAVIGLEIGDQPEEIVIHCPKSHGHREYRRRLGRSMAGALDELFFRATCDPSERVLALSLQSGCPNFEVQVDSVVLGRGEAGLFHDVYRTSARDPNWLGDQRAVTLRLRSLDPQCLYLGSEGPVREIKKIVSVDSGAQALWAEFDGRDRSPHKRTKRALPQRPYRL